MTGPRRHRGHHQHHLASANEVVEADADGGSKGPISLLQEYIQCSRDYPSPPNRPILQWSFDTRMADFTTLEFRGVVAFLLDGVPHHVAGTWQRAKKLAQRDAAERALGFFVHEWGQHLHSYGKGRALPTSRGVILTDSLAQFEAALEDFDADDEVELLEYVCQIHPYTGGHPPDWTVHWDSGRCHASAQVAVLGVPHRFEGSFAATEHSAKMDVAQKLLWYLHCPGYESTFEVDPRALSGNKDSQAPPPNWASSAEDEGALRVAEQKTILMRTQNKLQQVFAKQLKPGQSGGSGAMSQTSATKECLQSAEPQFEFLSQAMNSSVAGAMGSEMHRLMCASRF
eukprot:CAMPEP_0178437698 /NCGR_PEP_ID=MMETSP0689_2-20121128/35152_1 /TAXON_ID=160604 /ORGANISM="Amphidinium massartii, Strain CS-259" /LENGTH=341 /DNA_ID=CAMNT_0020059959 /DNA_START=57 /DNA_END=1083 /DNA_ORIENTATION=-